MATGPSGMPCHEPHRDCLLAQRYFCSASTLRFAKPVSKSFPIMPSIIKPMSRIIGLLPASPAKLQVTFVAAPSGSSFNVPVEVELKPSLNVSRYPSNLFGSAWVNSISPLPSVLLSHDHFAPRPDSAGVVDFHVGIAAIPHGPILPLARVGDERINFLGWCVDGGRACNIKLAR